MKRIALALVFVCCLTLSTFARDKKDSKQQAAPAQPEQIALDDNQYREVVRVYTAVNIANSTRTQAWESVRVIDLSDALKVVAAVGKAQNADTEVARAELERELVINQIRKAKACEGCGLSQDGKFLLRPAQSQPNK